MKFIFNTSVINFINKFKGIYFHCLCYITLQNSLHEQQERSSCWGEDNTMSSHIMYMMC